MGTAAACRVARANAARPALLFPAPLPAQVVALDRSHNKASSVRRLAESFGLTSVKAFKMDATKAVLRPEARQQQLQQQQQQQQRAAPPGQQQEGDAAGAGAGEGGRRGRRSGPTQPPSGAVLRRLERIAAARRARGLDTAPSAHTAAGKEAETPGFAPGSFDYVLCDAPCTALGLRPRYVCRVRCWANIPFSPTAWPLVLPANTPLLPACSPGVTKDSLVPCLAVRPPPPPPLQPRPPPDHARAAADGCLPAASARGCRAACAARRLPRLLHVQHKPRCVHAPLCSRLLWGYAARQLRGVAAHAAPGAWPAFCSALASQPAAGNVVYTRSAVWPVPPPPPPHPTPPHPRVLRRERGQRALATRHLLGHAAGAAGTAAGPPRPHRCARGTAEAGRGRAASRPGSAAIQKSHSGERLGWPAPQLG